MTTTDQGSPALPSRLPVTGPLAAEAGQLELNLGPIETPEYEQGLSIEDRFAAFHLRNPHVADTLERLAAAWLSRHQRVGMKALYEQARWASGMSTEGEPWLLNNDYTAYYARLLIERRPEWSEAFHLRALRRDRAA